MVEIQFQQKVRELIDGLKAICASKGLGNDGNEFKIITQVFLYKFLNDKFAYEAKKVDPTLEQVDKWEDQLSKMSDDDLEMLVLQMPPDTAILKPHHFISYLFSQQNEPDFATLFDDTLRDISVQNNEIFAVQTDGSSKIKLFDELSQFISDPSQRDDFCKAIINQLVEFSFERIFDQKFDFYASIFEYLIKDYNSNSGGKYAEYYTPHAVARIMAEILVPKDQQGQIKNVTCYDPAAGSGTLLMNVAHAIGETRCAIYTQDISQKSSNLLRLNLILNNLVHSIPNVVQGNTVLHPYHKDGSDLKKFDYIVSNPPFKLDFSDFRDDLDTKSNKERFFAGIPKVPAKAKEKMAIYQLFTQHIVSSLKDSGLAAIVLPTGFISAQSGIDFRIRKYLIENKMLVGVISMPSNIFATTNTNVSIIFIGHKAKSDFPVLIDASNLGTVFKEDKNQKTILSPQEEQKIIDCFTQKIEEDGFSVVVSNEKIIAKQYSFSAGQYFKIAVDKVDISAEEFYENINSMKDELLELFNEAKQVEESISSQLEGLKFNEF